MAFFLKTGSFYSISYTRWKTNPDRIYIFVLFGNPVANKVHALNLGARQLSTLDKARIVHTITRLSKIPSASKYSGQVLYRIFLTYLKPQVQKCYRTYFHTAISRATLFNYGLNRKEDFSPEDLKVYNPNMLDEARRDLLVRLINMYTLRGFDVQDLQAGLAKIGGKMPSYLGQTQYATPVVTPVTEDQEKQETETGTAGEAEGGTTTSGEEGGGEEQGGGGQTGPTGYE